jgi:hypothetical protein
MRACDNPFRSERILTLRYRLDGATWPELLARCECLGYRAAIVGPYGSGKTTLLEDLEPQLSERGFGTRFIQLRHEDPARRRHLVNRLAGTITTRDVVLFDGAEQLSGLAWQWFCWRTRHARGLIITMHRPGRLPILWECRTSAPLLAALASDLLACDQNEFRPRAEALFAAHQGNLREALRDCYDMAAQGTLHNWLTHQGFCTDTDSHAAIFQT